MNQSWLMLGHHLRRWRGISTTLVQHLAFAGWSMINVMIWPIGPDLTWPYQSWRTITLWFVISAHLCHLLQGVEPMWFQCWPTVYDAGPALKQHWFISLCLLGCQLSRGCYHAVQTGLKGRGVRGGGLCITGVIAPSTSYISHLYMPLVNTK